MPVDLIISADSHMTEPPGLWEERLDQAYRDKAPRMIENYQGRKGYFFVAEGIEPRSVAGFFAAGKTAEELTAFIQSGYSEARAGGWDPGERIKDQEIDGVQAEVLYTSLGFSLFQLPDAGLQEACFRAYNDWLAEFCSHHPKRLYGLALISLYDVENGIKELQRTAKLGLRGAMIWGSPPEDHDYGDRRYDPFWAAAQDLEMPISLHILTGLGKESRIIVGQGRITRYIAFPHEIQRSLATLISSGVLERYPNLKIVSSENDIGWIPHFLYRLDHAWTKFHAMEGTKLSLRPSDYFKRQVHATFQDDPVGIATRHFFGPDRIMWASDYPHADSTWPHSRKVIAENFAGVPEAEIKQMVAQNAIKLYRMNLN